jgi:uncharacterized metal-binding protein YceD (DUF177 family)
MSNRQDNRLDATIRIDNIPPEGRSLIVETTPEQREELSAVLKLSAVDAFKAEVTAVRFRGGIRVRGKIEATVVQPCVVTLEPVTQEIEEPVDRIFLPGAETRYSGTPGAEIFVDLEEDELPDPLEGPEVDLAPMLTESLALAIDPYPRAPGASVENLGLPPDEEEPSPFAALKALKPGGENP